MIAFDAVDVDFFYLKKLKIIVAFAGLVTLCSDFNNSPLIHHQDGKGDKSCPLAVLSESVNQSLSSK